MTKVYRKAKEMVFGEDDIRIMSVGPSGVGKSTIGNALLMVNRKDPHCFKTQASADSCTKESATIVSEDGKMMYTDVPGIPDTDPNSTKDFYNILINEAKEPCTAIFFVFAVDGRMDGPTKDRIKQCALLFNEVNNCSAVKILILNDMKAWINPDDLDEDDDDYELEKAKHEEVRKESQLRYEKDIKEATGISFHCTKVLNGIKKDNKGNMKETLKILKATLKSFKCNASPHLRTFEDLEKEVNDAENNQDHEQRLVNEQRAVIKRLEEEIKNLTIARDASAATATAAATASGVAAFFTFGTSLLVGGGVAAAAAAAAASTAIAIIVKERELSAAKSKIDTKNLEDAVKAYKEQLNMFKELKKSMEAVQWITEPITTK